MSFTPPCCPNSACPSNGVAVATRQPPPFLWQRAGFFWRALDGRRVQRFRCLRCGRRFSAQSFRLDYRLKKPALNQSLLIHFLSKVTQRQSARMLGISRSTVARRLDLLGSHADEFQAGRLVAARLAGKCIDGLFQLDEMESFEQDRRLGPLTIPVLIEKHSRFVVATKPGTLAARGNLSPFHQARKKQREAREGVRRSQSGAVVKACFELLKELRGKRAGPLLVATDCKASYPVLLRDVFGKAGFRHQRTSGTLPRDTKNPLFAINHTLAMLRDGASRLVRRTWGHAKKKEKLALQLALYRAWRNFVRSITNKRVSESPAMVLGIEERRWTKTGFLRFRGRFARFLRVQ